MSIAKKLWNFMLETQRIILFISSLAIVIGITIQVFFRYVLEISLFGTEDIIIIFAFWLYFIGSSYGTYERSHISADIVNAYIKSKVFKAVFKCFISLISLALCLLFTFWAIDFFMWGVEKGSRSTSLHIPMYIPQSSIFFSFILMSMYLTVHLIKDIINAVSLSKSTN